MSQPIDGDSQSAPSASELDQIVARLQRSRPAPGATLRREVRAFLTAVDISGLLMARPRHLWARAAVCAGVGGVLLGLVAAGLGGWGPFAG